MVENGEKSVSKIYHLNLRAPLRDRLTGKVAAGLCACWYWFFKHGREGRRGDAERAGLHAEGRLLVMSFASTRRG